MLLQWDLGFKSIVRLQRAAQGQQSPSAQGQQSPEAALSDLPRCAATWLGGAGLMREQGACADELGPVEMKGVPGLVDLMHCFFDTTEAAARWGALQPGAAASTGPACSQPHVCTVVLLMPCAELQWLSAT